MKFSVARSCLAGMVSGAGTRKWCDLHPGFGTEAADWLNLLGPAATQGSFVAAVGKHRAAAARVYWNSGFVRNWPAIPLSAGLALGTSHGPKLSLWGFPMRISNRSAFRHCSKIVDVTNSNRRVRTRTHGGVAGVGGCRRPYGRSMQGRGRSRQLL